MYINNYEFVIAAGVLFVAFGGVNFTLGRCYWRHPRLAKWLTSLIPSLIVVAAMIRTLLLYAPGLIEHLFSFMNAIIAFMLWMGIAMLYRRIFALGNRHAYYIPDPNQTYEYDDLPPMPSN